MEEIRTGIVKVCRRGLNDIWVDRADGSVRMCGWANFYAGNLTEQTIEEIWHGKRAEQFRESMLDGSYRYCNHSKCPHCANNELQNNMVEYTVPEYPRFCSLSYQLQCNYVCKFCRNKHYIPCECERENYIKIEQEIKKMTPHLEVLSANGAGEFFCSDSIIKLVNDASFNKDIKFELESNGSLFNAHNWEKISKLGQHDLSVAITLHSFNESTYQYLSGTNISVEQVIENLYFISELRKQGKINKFEIATVICERNFREMPEFVKKCLDSFAMDTIRLRFFEPYRVMDLNTEWFYDVRNKYHPYHDEFVKVMEDPILKNEKVWKWQGDTESLQRENPYVLEHKNVLAISNMILQKNMNEKMRSYVKYLGDPKMALYGANAVGMAVRKVLNDFGFYIETVFDKYLEEKQEEDFEIKHPNEEKLNEFGLIIITSEVHRSQILEELERMKYSGKSMTISELLNAL